MNEFTVDVPVRFRDLDPMGHVNNAVYATYLEVARGSYFADVVGVPLIEADTVLANLSIDYRRSVAADGTVEVALWVPELGESSIPMEYEVRTGEGVAATAETVQVVFDRETGDSRPIPAEWRERITTHAEDG